MPAAIPTPAPLHPVLRSTLWMMGALVSFMAMAVSGRELSSELGTFQILFFRSLVGLVVVAALLTRSGWHHARTGQPGMQLLRNLAHYGGQYGWFYGIALIPLAEVFAIEFTVPIWTALLAAWILGERLSRARLAAVAFGIVGMLIILRPGLSVVHPASLVVLAGAVGYAVAHTLTRKLTRTDTPLAVLFYMTAIQLPLGFIAALPDWTTPSPGLWPWLVVVGVTALSAHYCLTRALTLSDAMVVVPMDFLRVPLIALVGYLVYGEALDWFVLGGALVMLTGNLVNIRAEQRRA
jgi:drug/metabolite transporter (DMT)-like permease